MLEDDLDALAVFGQAKLAYVDGAPEQQVRLALQAAIVGGLDTVIADLTPIVTAADFSSPAALAQTVVAAGDLAVYTAVRAQLT